MSVFKVQFYRDGERIEDAFVESKREAEEYTLPFGLRRRPPYQHATITEMKPDRSRVLRGCYIMIGDDYHLVAVDEFDRSLARARGAAS